MEVWISVATLTVSSVLLLLELSRRRRERRRGRGSRWDLRLTGTATRNGEHYAHILKLANAGYDSATLFGSWLVGATPISQDNPLAPSTFLPGAQHTLFIDADNIDEAWLCLAHIDAADTRELTIEWHALTPHGTPRQEEDRQLREEPQGRRKARRDARRAGPVGPGPDGKSLTVLRIDKRSYEEGLRTAARIATQAQGVSIHT